MANTAEEKEFNMTKEELNKLQKCMKKKEFRDLLVEYAKEISDPENKKKYEEEIAQMERDRGRDVKFVNPEDGFVVKTTRKSDGLKAFVNICYNQHIQKATAANSEREENGKRQVGQQWHIPYSLSHARDDLDNVGKKCVVYDAVFNPDTYKKGLQDQRFKKLLVDTALDGIERQHKVKLDKKNLKFPKSKFKGVKQATVIRSDSARKVESKSPPDQDLGGMKFPYPYNDGPTHVHEHKEKEKKPEECSEKKSKKTGSNEPTYRIVHRGHIDFQNFTCARDSNSNVTRPKELVVYIELPLKRSAAGVDLDIFEKQLLLDCKKPSYHLDINLPYPIDEENGSAKFDKSKKQLVVTLPVMPAPPVISSSDQDNELAVENPESTEAQADSEGINNLENSTNDARKSPQCESSEDSTNDQTVNGGITSSVVDRESTCAASDNDTSGAAHSEAIADKSGPSGNVVEHSRKDNPEFDDMPEQLPMEQAAAEDKSGPSVDVVKHSRKDDPEFDDMPDLLPMEQAAAEDKSGPSGDVVEHSREDAPKSELLPMEQAMAEDSSPPVVLSDVEDVQFDLPSSLKEFSSPLLFNCPPYTYHQDEETVTFIINVPDLSLEDISLGFNDNKCYISFPSEAGSPHELPSADYALYVAFPEGYTLDTELCHIDVNKYNVVLILQKSESSQGLWESFKAGIAEEKLEDKYFVTEKSVEMMLKEIAEQDPWVRSIEKPRRLVFVGLGTRITIENEAIIDPTDSESVPNGSRRSPDASRTQTHENPDRAARTKALAKQDAEHKETGPLSSETDFQVTSVSVGNLTIELESRVIDDDTASVQRHKEEGSGHFDVNLVSEIETAISETATEEEGATEETLNTIKQNENHDNKMIAKCYQAFQNNIENLASKTRSWSLSSDGESEVDNGVSGRGPVPQEPADKSSDVPAGLSPRETKHVSFDPNTIENAKKIRKSCLRRTSSTCSEESFGEYSSDTSGTEGCGSLSDSPRKNVRFNFNPEVRVFSNKKDKKRRKIEEKMRKEKEAANKAAEATKEAVTEETNARVDEKENNVGTDQETPKINGSDSKGENGAKEYLEDLPSRKQEPVLTNSLIFDLDD